MAATIPPLMCDTPPPIDDVIDDDFGGFETSENGYNFDGKLFICTIKNEIRIFLLTF